MIRQTLLRQQTALTRAITSSSRATQLRPAMVMVNRRDYSIVDSAKETLSNLNKKIGEAAAAGIEKAEDATESVKDQHIVDKAKESLDAVNKKVGQAAASGIESAETATKNVDPKDITEKAKGAADYVNKKTGKAAAEAIDFTQEATKSTLKDAENTYDKAKKEGEATKESLEQKAEATLKDAKAAAAKYASVEEDLKNFGSSTATEEELQQTEPPTTGSDHVKENIKGYKSLQHKGKKAYSEQNRPEDFM